MIPIIPRALMLQIHCHASLLQGEISMTSAPLLDCTLHNHSHTHSCHPFNILVWIPRHHISQGSSLMLLHSFICGPCAYISGVIMCNAQCAKWSSEGMNGKEKNPCNESFFIFFLFFKFFFLHKTSRVIICWLSAGAIVRIIFHWYYASIKYLHTI